MLVLGLQKAAEQTARQKSINSMESAPPGASTPDQKQLSEDRIATPPQNHAVVETDSPSGIMRGFYSRKKSQRVSFADHPVVYTFGPSPNSSRESSGSGSPVGRCSASDTATEGSSPTLNKESDSHPPLSADSGAPSSPSSSLPEAPAGLQPLQSCIEPSQPLLDK
ncbi:unnamed protein product [Dicrocoelium dendriticum]|nr:unnamed protein product [Dicrocoelium dendriticum]